jgi:endonuclease G, mitochondrial
MKSIKTILQLSILMLFACQSNYEENVPSKAKPQISVREKTSNADENFESGSKGSYADGNVTLITGSWAFSDALLGTLSSDSKNGSKSARIRNTGSISMNFNLADGANTVQLLYAKFGSDGNSDFVLEYSANSGSSWQQSGQAITVNSTSLQSASFALNTSGDIRLRVRKTSGGSSRINIDDFLVTAYSGGNTGSANESEPNNSISTANLISVNPTTITGYLSSSSDRDYFEITNSGSSQISLHLDVPAGKDYDLYLVNSAGTFLASSENWNDADENIQFTVNTSGSNYILVYPYSGSSSTSSYSLDITVTSSGGQNPSSVHLTFGNPSNAMENTSFSTNYLMIKNGYALSYNEAKANPNWVSWHLDNSWTGSAARQNDYRSDTALPSTWNKATGGTFGGGFDRGHMTPSADRTSTVTLNSETFLMTNFLPQGSNNNQGPWNNMEQYLRSLFPNELYIIAGGSGSLGTTSNGGAVNIPEKTWKVIIVLSNGTNDVSRVTNSTRTIAVIMPNDNSAISRSADWKSFRVSINDVEALTGYDFFSEIPDAIENTIEAVVDNL